MVDILVVTLVEEGPCVVEAATRMRVVRERGFCSGANWIVWRSGAEKCLKRREMSRKARLSAYFVLKKASDAHLIGMVKLSSGPEHACFFNLGIA